MKLAAKLVSVVLLGIIVLVGIDGYLSVSQEVERFERVASAEAQRLGQAIGTRYIEELKKGGAKRAGQWMDQVVKQEQYQLLQIRPVDLQAPGDSGRSEELAEKIRPALMQNRTVSVKVTDNLGNRLLFTYWPVPVKGQLLALRFAKSMSAVDDFTRSTVYRTLAQMGAMIVVSGVLLAVVGVRMVGRPLEKLIDKTRRIAAGDLTGEVRIRTRDELGELARSLNDMSDRLRESQDTVRDEVSSRIAAMDQLRHADRLRTVGRLASGLAHELGTPLNVVSGRAGLIASGKLSPEEVTSSAATIKDEAETMATIIRQLLDFARRSSPQRRSVDLQEIARQTVDLLSALAHKANVSLDLVATDRTFTANIDVAQVQQVLTNLIMNAIQAMRQEGAVTIAIQEVESRNPSAQDEPDRTYFCLEIQDQGEGIAEEHLNHLFEPFFTTKDIGEGTGLGLSIAYGIVEEHGGWIGVQSEPGNGSCFRVYLPKELDS